MKYKHIWAWGRMMGSYKSYVDGQIEQAKIDNAPEDAVYKNSKGQWVRFSEVKSEVTKASIESILKYS